MSYQLDPKADLELVLRKPNTQVLLPSWASIKLNKAATNQAIRKLAINLSQRPGPISAPNPFQPSSTSTSANGTSVSFTREFPQHSSPTMGQPEDPQQTEVRFRVSLKHLKLGSPAFRAMLDGPWIEGASSNGPRRLISASDWDKDALLILFNIIHGHHGEVPKSLELETLCKFATIIDYYKCYEIVEIFADRWLSAMEGRIPLSTLANTPISAYDEIEIAIIIKLNNLSIKRKSYIRLHTSYC
jgi:hypothetical protein